MQCVKCHRTFEAADRLGSMSGSIMGDESTDSYFFCPVCQVYTVGSWRDNFTGEETESVSGPLAKPAGDERVALIRQCDRPWDKKCRCAAHMSYFNGALD